MVRGLLIGNGWIAPTEQYLSYLPMVYKTGLIQGGSDKAKQLESQQAVCTTRLNAPGGTDHVDLPECEKILTQILRLAQREDKKDAPCVNMYDIRLRDSYPSCGMNWPPDLDFVTPYLRRQEVVRALHVNEDKKSGWTECVGSVGSSFKAAHSKPSITLLPSLLQHMPVILFSGDQDLICNHMGTEELIHNMEWNGGKGFELSPGVWAPRRDWTFEGEPAGIYQEARNLTYILFYNASHMVPFDYPRRTRDMLDRFMGVDIASIGGKPADSRIDGEKGLEVSVGGHPNSTIAQEKEKQRLKQAAREAYYKSAGLAALVTIFLLCLWAWMAWRDRRRRQQQNDPTRGAYQEVYDTSSGDILLAPHHQRHKRYRQQRQRQAREADLEAADFDESELDNLHVPAPAQARADEPRESEERFKVGHSSEDEESVKHKHEEGRELKERNGVVANGKRVDR